METIVKAIQDIDIFNKVKNHLINQGDKCISVSSEDCAYVGIKDNDIQKILSVIEEDYNEDWDYRDLLIEQKRFEMNIPFAQCAVGALIEPKFYHDLLEGTLVDGELVSKAVQDSNPNWKMTDQSLDMLKALQAVHDNLIPELWDNALDMLSDTFDKEGNWIGDFREPKDKNIRAMLDNFKYS